MKFLRFMVGVLKFIGAIPMSLLFLLLFILLCLGILVLKWINVAVKSADLDDVMVYIVDDYEKMYSTFWNFYKGL